VPVRAELPGTELAQVFRNAGVRTGLGTGVGLVMVFTIWLYVANRIPSLESVALERNILAAAALGILAMVPVLRFLRHPGELLVSTLLAWTVFALAYRGLCLFFRDLADRYTAPQIFTLGAVVYLIVATISWIVSCIWRVRESHASHASHSNHQV
jgi:hypothetical protein